MGTFKGTEIALAELVLSGKSTVGSTLRFRVLFTDKEGLVHATVNHDIEPTSNERIHAATKELVAAIVEWTETAHFTDSPNSPKAKKVLRGIAETLHDGSDSADDPGGQG